MAKIVRTLGLRDKALPLSSLSRILQAVSLDIDQIYELDVLNASLDDTRYTLFITDENDVYCISDEVLYYDGFSILDNGLTDPDGILESPSDWFTFSDLYSMMELNFLFLVKRIKARIDYLECYSKCDTFQKLKEL